MAGCIERLDFEELIVSVPHGEDRKKCLEVLGREFGHDNAESFSAKLAESLSAQGDQVSSDGGVSKAGEIFRLESRDSELKAVSVVKYYTWNLLSEQICYKCERDDKEEISGLGLIKFGDLVKTQVKDFSLGKGLVAEMAYNFVDTSCRGQHLGSKMFALRVLRSDYLEADLIFAIARGAHLDSGEGKKLRNVLIEKERQKNGNHADGRAIIKGGIVSIDEARNILKVEQDFDFEKIYPSSEATAHISRKMGMKQIGLFNDLSPVFACA